VRDSEFFEVATEQSQIKAKIVRKYFTTWANIMKLQVRDRPNPAIAYVDLFAGPGVYSSSEKSTPVLVIEEALKDPDLCRMLVTVFNDKNPEYIASLRDTISQIPNLDRLAHKPQFLTETVGDELARNIASRKLVPTLFFVDPFGYKGLTLDLIDGTLKSWGCECIFFFNYNRIRAGIENDIVEHHMAALFGELRAREMSTRLNQLRPSQHEAYVLDSLAHALKDGHGERRYVLPFTFKNDRGTRTSHHLVFVTKHHLGYEKMKDVMWAESSNRHEGVASFSYCPADNQFPLLAEMYRPLDDLRAMLLDYFRGRTLSVRRIFEEHHVDRPFVLNNYKAVLLQLETEGIVTCKSDKRRVRGRIGDNVEITFPQKGAA
jgi:three-Cys-motif partner protein